MTRETFAAIDSPRFYAGIVLRDDLVVKAAPIVWYMKKWTRDRVREYCCQRGWRVFVVEEVVCA